MSPTLFWTIYILGSLAACVLIEGFIGLVGMVRARWRKRQSAPAVVQMQALQAMRTIQEAYWQAHSDLHRGGGIHGR